MRVTPRNWLCRLFGLGWRYFGDALLLGLLVQEADEVVAGFTLLRGHGRSLRKTADRTTLKGDAQRMVNFSYRMTPGRNSSFALVNRSFCSSRSLQPLQTRVYLEGRGRNSGERRQEFVYASVTGTVCRR